MKKICGIYKIANNINGKSYIGQSKNCEYRLCYHKSPSVNYAPIDKTINEFGKENFTFSILLECPSEMLDVWERDMINLHDTLYPNGYNMKGGGRSGFDTCEDTRIKMSESNKGKHTGPFTEEHIKKLSESKKGERHPNYGKHLSEETKQKISKAHKGVSQPKYKWLTPSGEIKEMAAGNAKNHHPDWVKIEE